MDTIRALFTPFAIQVGVGCMTAQLLLALAFSRSFFGPGPWQQLPMFTAHQVVVVPVLLFLSIAGCWEWFQQLFLLSNDVMISQTDKVIAPRNLYLSEFVFGMMLFWDFPTSLLSRELREVAMVLHHIGMALVAAVALGALSNGNPLLGYYAPFFFGLVEVSSVPLIVVDMFHPKHKEWHAYIKNKASPALNSLNETCRIVFAALFLVLRAVYFPFETLFGVIPDLLALRALKTDIPNLPLDFLVVSNLMFSILQLYWGYLIVQQLMKLLRRGSSKKSQ